MLHGRWSSDPIETRRENRFVASYFSTHKFPLFHSRRRFRTFQEKYCRSRSIAFQFLEKYQLLQTEREREKKRERERGNLSYQWAIVIPLRSMIIADIIYRLSIVDTFDSIKNSFRGMEVSCVEINFNEHDFYMKIRLIARRLATFLQWKLFSLRKSETDFLYHELERSRLVWR